MPHLAELSSFARACFVGSLALGAIACARGPQSGKYCEVDASHECVRIDIENDVVTFYEDGRPNDVTGVYLHGAIEAFPTTGKYARKLVRLTFDRDAADRLKLELHPAPSGATEPALYQLKK